MRGRGCSDAGYSLQAEAPGDGDGRSGVGTWACKLCWAAGTVSRRGCCRGVFLVVVRVWG